MSPCGSFFGWELFSSLHLDIERLAAESTKHVFFGKIFVALCRRELWIKQEVSPIFFASFAASLRTLRLKALIPLKPRQHLNRKVRKETPQRTQRR
jgi:hypothetical protein